MLDSVFNFLQGVAEFSLLGFLETISVILVVYFIYAKTRAPAIIAGLFPNLHLNINYRSSLVNFNNMGNELLTTLRSGNVKSNTSVKTEPKQQQQLLAHGLGTQNLLQVTPLSGHKPFYSLFDWGAYLPFVAQSVRIKKYEFTQVSGFVRRDPILQRAIKQAAEQILREQQQSKQTQIMFDLSEQSEAYVKKDNPEEDEDDGLLTYHNILQKQERRSLTILKDMSSTLNNFLLMLTSWLLYKLLPWFLSGVVTHTPQIEMLKTAAERAPGIPLIFLPLHRSHLDYIMVTFILANSDIRSPLVAAGNNLQIPVFGALLRGLGAFYIKRKIDPVVGKKDILYRAILHLYLQHALKMGHNVEFFIEGGRTRTGKPCMPKGGILSIIVNAYMDGSIPDALLVPVSLNYERLVDGNFVREQRGEDKVPESFGKAISGIWKALNSKYGLMRIDFNQPYSIKELVQSYNKIASKGEGGNQKIYKPAARTLQHIQSTSSLYGTDVVCEEHRTLIESISRQVVYDCAAATSVMSTNALAFLLLTRYRQGAPDKEIAHGLDQLRQILKGQKDMGFAGDSLHIVNYACDLLGTSLVLRTQDEKGQSIIKPLPTVESFIELAYYSNSLTPHFALQSILLTTLHNMLPQKETSEVELTERPGVVRKKLLEAALESCEIYRYEYILHKPTQILENLLEITLDELVIQGLIQLETADEKLDTNPESRRMARNLASYLGESDDEEYENGYISMENIEQPDLFLAPSTVAQQKVICEVLAPFSHTYFAVAQSVNILYQNSMLESEFIKFVMQDLTNKVSSGTCPYAESISTDSVRNIMKVLEKWSVIEIVNQHGLRLVALGATYDHSKDSLKTIVQRVAAIVPNYKNGYF